MNWEQSLEIVVRQTNHARFRELCADDHPDREYWRADMIERAKFPSVFEQAKNAMGAVGRVVQAVVTRQPVQASPLVMSERLAICGVCPELVDNRCRLCGCHFMAKISLATEHCPMDPPKWEAETTVTA